MFLLMLAWSGLYYLYGCLTGSIQFTGLSALVTYLLTEPVHLWYCYAMIALYLFTPPLGVFCRHASKQELQYTLALTFFLGSIVTIALRTERFPLLPVILGKMKVDSTLGFVFLYLMGDYLRTYPPTARQRKVTYLLGLVGLAVTYGGTAYLSRGGTWNDLLFSFFAPNVMASSLAVYMLVRQLCLAHPVRRGQSLLRKLSECTLGVYFLHPLVISMVQDFGAEPWHALPVAIPLRTLIFFGTSASLVLVLRQVPILRRLVR